MESSHLVAARLVAARLVVVDAIDEQAAAFYRKFGFVPVPQNRHRLVQKMSDIEAAMEAQQDARTPRGTWVARVVVLDLGVPASVSRDQIWDQRLP